MSDDEWSAVERRAYTDDLHEKIGDMFFGGWEQREADLRLDAWNKAHEHFAGEDVVPDQYYEDDHPMFRGNHAGWDFTHRVGSAGVDIHLPGKDWNDAVDHVDFGPDDPREPIPEVKPDQIRSVVEDWDAKKGDEYRKHYGI